MATAEFSKSAGILSAALSLHHLSGFERAQLECRIKHLAISISATDFSQGMNNKEDVTLTKAALP